MKSPGLGRLRHLITGLCVGLVSALSCAQVWHPFEWASGDIAGRKNQRLAMFLPAQVDGVACFLQLDTGMNSAIRWHGGDEPAADAKEVTVALLGISRRVRADAQTLARLKQPHFCAKDVLGSVGNQFFENGSLMLDLQHQRFAFEEKSLLAAHPKAQPMFYARWTPLGGHPLIEVKLGDAPVSYALLDTGFAMGSIGVLTQAE